jgi:hypothetical protein
LRQLTNQQVTGVAGPANVARGAWRAERKVKLPSDSIHFDEGAETVHDLVQLLEGAIADSHLAALVALMLDLNFHP